MDRLLLIDGNNLAWKAAYAYNLSTSSGVDTSAIAGFFLQLVSIFEKRRPKTVVVWDGGHPERTCLAQAAVEKGLIVSGYKENRGEQKAKMSGMSEQLAAIEELLSHTDLLQLRIPDREADDVIASYCEKFKNSHYVICFTCDKDYFQLLDDSVAVVSRLKGEETIHTKESFMEEYGIEPWQWVEVGALAGDSSDNIHGVPGCGEKTALDLIKKYSTAKMAVQVCQQRLAPLRASCPDVTDPDELAEIRAMKGNAFKECIPGMPFSGVALALARGEIKKVNRLELACAMHEERVKLARRLKQMQIADVPELIFSPTFDHDAFVKSCAVYELNKVATSAYNFKIHDSTV